MNELSDAELIRYSRQILLPEIGYEGQTQLRNSHALIIGLGGLGSPVALYLAAAGLGHLTLVDFDDVDTSNLQRQIIHDQASVGLSKVASAEARIARLNPNTTVTAHPQKLDETDMARCIHNADVVVDASDNFATRFLLNRLCHRAHTPLVSGAAIRWEGQLSTFDFRQHSTPCYQCLYPDTSQADASCAQNGVAAPVVGAIGSLQALETIKVLAGLETLQGVLLLMDGLHMQWRRLNLTSDPDCPVCQAAHA
ncbi:molybdopterin-synthase adenylyltransferase MoeB [Thiomicrospira sp. WB1]|uniref:HesA/MoeB/ThiF family protein n=1 Tax=Thiomicrospira sp. WB1 TaxID=1685380 RepID=UPI000747FCE4|nr:molybdopterin-synthase adenylyltransferase MoeB [Thiomicrospira sp. WB1]KUJ72606.1 molybdopterin-synthase adenylyltransferase [Thiomicrospira sp. WB1]